MSKRKYNIDKKPLSKEEIDSFKDFDGLMDKLGNGNPPDGSQGLDLSNFIGYIKTALIVAGAAIVGWFAINMFSGEEGSSESVSQETQISEPEAPKYKVEPPFNMSSDSATGESFSVIAESGRVLTTGRGSEFIIPASAFQHEDGSLVTGEVKVFIEEYHNPFEIFTSGIPMHYDSAGANYTFESAGMFKITAKQGGKTLSQEFKKEIEVNLVTYNTDEKFNSYYFDEEQGEWLYKGRSEVTTKANVPVDAPEEVSDIEEDIFDGEPSLDGNLILPIPPTAPSLPAQLMDKYSFSVAFDQAKFSELDKDVVFQVDEEKSTFSAAYYDVNWEKVELKRSEISGRYVVHLEKGKTALDITCFPALPPEVYKQKLARYNAAMKEYNSYTDSLAAIRAQGSYNTSTEQRVINEVLNRQTTVASKNTRKFRVARQGFYNSDHPVVVKTAWNKSVIAHFTVEGEKVDPKRIYVVAGAQNMLVSALDRSKKVYYDAKAENKMWILYNDRIALANPSDFLGIKTNQAEFKLRSYPQEEGLKVLKEWLAAM